MSAHVCRQIDNSSTKFTIEIRSMGTVDTDVVKRLIEQRFEVVDIKKDTIRHNYIRNNCLTIGESVGERKNNIHVPVIAPSVVHVEW